MIHLHKIIPNFIGKNSYLSLNYFKFYFDQKRLFEL